MTERLSAPLVVQYNQILCRDSGENSALLDPDGLDAAIERPWSGMGEEEFFPTLYDKAAALLHGIASRQIFENGNKRTAWAAAVALLDVNDIDIGRVDTVQSDMFVRAAALDHSLEIADLAEWFRVAATKRAGITVDESSNRLPIRTVGRVLSDRGVPHLQGWAFDTSVLPEGEQMDLEVVGNTLAGWPVGELHLVAHGRPCDCEVAGWLSAIP